MEARGGEERDMSGRTPVKFHKKYCEGGKNSLGYWTADGRSEAAETELVERLSVLMIKRPREVIWKDTPPKTRQVIWLDIDAKDEDPNLLAKKLTSETHLFRALEKLLPYYVDDVIERVVENILNGEKDVIWVLTRDSVEIMANALEKACEAKDVRTRVREVNCRIWATHGDADVKARNDVARAYREHNGAAVIIATMDSLPESISLFGATTEHYAQLHYLPGPMEQSENRPYLKDTSKLHIVYYVPKNTVAERILNLLWPRLLTADKIGDSKDSSATHALFAKKEESFDDWLARLTANGPEDGEAVLGGSVGADDEPLDDD